MSAAKSDKQAITEEQGIHKAWYDEAQKMTLANLPEFLRRLTEDYDHDYGTICHAIAAGAIATAYAVNHSDQGGITGFQAGAIMWEFIRHWNYSDGDRLRIINYKNMLYPQYFDSFRTISPETWDWLRAEAKRNLSEKHSAVVPAVIEHWETIVDGRIPFGYRVQE